jgi:ABC-type branched-subunit amino acid transport system substrate-binding protein
MFAAFQSTRKRSSRTVTRSFAGLAFLALAACEPIDLSSLSGGNSGQQIDPNTAVPVALLIPRGSGNPGDDLLAKSLENAAALAVSELQGAKIDLRVYSTAGNPQQAALQAQQAVSDGAKIILGPVYAASANAAGVAVANQNVNVLSFSNNTSIAGGNVFVLGPTFNNTADRLVSYAASKGKNRIVVVHGNDVSGQAGRDAILSAAASSSAQVVGSVDYQLSQTGVTAAVPRVKAAVDSNGANAVFMTSTSSGALPLYAGLLPEAGVNPASTQYIGLTRWDIPTQTMSLGGLQGGWFALPDPSRTAAFNSRYQARYGTSPHPIGGLAFDGIAAIGALVAQGKKDALTTRSLTQANGFQGVSGVFRLRPNGTNQRAVAVATVRNGQAVIVDPAPQSFGGF